MSRKTILQELGSNDILSIGVTLTLLYLGAVNTPFWDTMEMRVQRNKILTPETRPARFVSPLNSPPSEY